MQVQISERIAVIKIIIHVTIGRDKIEPLEPVADATENLPGYIRASGADIRIMGQIPVLAEVYVPFDADNAVPYGV